MRRVKVAQFALLCGWRCPGLARYAIDFWPDAPLVPFIASDLVHAAAWSATNRVTSGRWLKQASHQPYRIPSIRWYATVRSSVIW